MLIVVQVHVVQGGMIDVDVVQGGMIVVQVHVDCGPSPCGPLERSL